MKESCIDQFDAMNCQAAGDFCDSQIGAAFFSTGRPNLSITLVRMHTFMLLLGKNPYDISKDCDGPIEETLCYPVTK